MVQHILQEKKEVRQGIQETVKMKRAADMKPHFSPLFAVAGGGQRQTMPPVFTDFLP